MRRILIYAISLVIGTAGCGEDDDAAGGDGARVVATTPLVADLARNVGQDRANVESMLPSNADPHDYEPKPSDAAALAAAEVVLRSGGDLDEWIDDLVESAGTDGEVVSLIDSAQAERTDPHWWHDPSNAVAAVGAIRAALVEADPAGAEIYAKNAERYEREIRAL